MRSAYIVIWVDRTASRVEDVGIYSEMTPTGFGGGWSFCWKCATGRDYRDARAKALKFAKQWWPELYVRLREKMENRP